MFMRYTDLGVGHPVILRKIARDCFGSALMAAGGPANTMDDAADEEVSGDEDHEVCDDEEEDSDEIDDDELGDEDEEDWERDNEVVEDVFEDTLSF
jgi:hypothetical protein